ncbi:MAG: hypothetical protein GY750_06015 [Lentisphaerae bacterium]|nr:hypothetical protein [Lentisphaerota bacterium]
MMEFYILIGFIWIVGWLYTCGIHHGNKEVVRKHGTTDDKNKIDKGGAFQYVTLFFGWPHYLGYGK